MTRKETCLDKAIADVRRWNQRIALIGAHLVDRFEETRSAAELDELKDYVRAGLRDARRRIATYRGRDQRRGRHFTARIKRKKELGPRLEGHLKALQVRIGLYEDRMNQLRQLADAALWLLLDTDIRRVGLLYKDGRHDLPSGVGLVGVVQLQAELHESRHFLTMENDLTRCAGLGDITVVRADRQPTVPFLLEVKTHSESGDLEEGAEIGIMTLTAATGRPLDQETLALLEKTIGSNLPHEMVVSARAERQAGEIMERTKLIAKMMGSGATVVAPPRRNWSALKNVIASAAVRGEAFHMAERGVYYFAVRIGPGRTPGESMRSVRSRIEALARTPLFAGISTQLQEQADISGIVPPIALWNLPLAMRADLLSNHIVAGAFVESDLFARLFSERGISLSEREDGWTMTGEHGEEGGVGPLMLSAIRLGVVFGALSPASVVETLAQGVKQAAAA